MTDKKNLKENLEANTLENSSSETDLSTGLIDMQVVDLQAIDVQAINVQAINVQAIDVQENQNTVMLVGAVDEHRDRLKALLEREDTLIQEVQVFDTTTELLDRLEQVSQPEDMQLINMIIVDWVLSDNSLPKLVRRLQQAPFSQIPLVALAESPCIEIKEALMFLKQTTIVQKPVKTNDMLNTLQKFLNQPTQSARTAELNSYSLLESNSLLELAIKNHQSEGNSQLPQTGEASLSEHIN